MEKYFVKEYCITQKRKEENNRTLHIDMKKKANDNAKTVGHYVALCYTVEIRFVLDKFSSSLLFN